jgi:hypothetical protein
MAEDDETAAFREYLTDATKRSVEAITDSASFIAIYSPSFQRDPVALMQLGLAVVLDKPLYLLVVKGAVVGENICRLARHIEVAASPEDTEFATKRLLAQALKDGVINPK